MLEMSPALPRHQTLKKKELNCRPRVLCGAAGAEQPQQAQRLENSQIVDLVCSAAQLVLSNPSKRVMERLRCGRFDEVLGREYFFVRIHDAVEYCQLVLQSEVRERLILVHVSVLISMVY